MKIRAFKKIIRPKGWIIFLFISLWVSTLNAQTYYFDDFSVTEGLAQSTVFTIIQDQNDILWLGTRAGVSQFDGMTFDNKTVEDGLAPGGIRAICEDSQGNIWLGHEMGGITRFNGEVFEVSPESKKIFESSYD